MSSSSTSAAASNQYVLSTAIAAHQQDVRAVKYRGQLLVTGSRDMLAKLWQRSDVSPSYSQIGELKGHNRYIMCVAVTAPTEANPHGLILTGSLDQRVLVWSPLSPAAPIAEMKGHTDAVCGIDVSPSNGVVTSSWDSTARIWTLEGVCLATLSGHDKSVTCCAFTEDGRVLTGSADTSMKLWAADDPSGRQWVQQTTFHGHTDAVRALSVVDSGRFLSASNDATIRLWTLDGSCLSSYHGHENYIYGVVSIPRTQLFVSSSEDGTLKVWDMSQPHPVQSIDTPCQSLWAVAASDDGDVAVACDDGVCRIFTRNPDRRAPADALAIFEESVRAFHQSKQQQNVGAITVSSLPTPDVLQMPGSENGQTKLVNNRGKVQAYEWSAAENQWKLIGEVTDAVKKDYTIKVELDDRTINLEFNKGEDPYEVAQKFIEKNNLEQHHLSTIADFIIRNTEATAPSQLYMPSASSNTFIMEQQPPSGFSSAHFPLREAVLYRKVSHAPLIDALKSSNAQGVDDAFVDSLLRYLESVAATGPVPACPASLLDKLATLAQLLSGPQCVPVLDALRVAVCGPVEDKTDSIGQALLSALTSASRVANAMLCLRGLANLIGFHAGKVSLGIVRQALQVIQQQDASRTPNTWHTAAATVVLNTCVMLVTNGPDEEAAELELHLLQLAVELASAQPSNDEGTYRSLVAIGNLVSTSDVLKAAAVSMPTLGPLLEALRSDGSRQQKVKEVAADLGRLLSSV